MEQLTRDIREHFPQYTLCSFEELELCWPKNDNECFKYDYARTMAVVGLDLCSAHERYEVHAFIQKHAQEHVFTMGFATGRQKEERKCQCCKQYLTFEPYESRFLHSPKYVCYTCIDGECGNSEYGRPDSCVRGGRPYFPRMKDAVLFAFHDFRPRKEVLRQRKQVKRRLPEILLQIHSEKETRLSWLPKDLIKLIASF